MAYSDRHGSRIWLLSVVHPQTVEHIQHLHDLGEEDSESAYLRSVADQLSEAGYPVRWEVTHGTDATPHLAGFVSTHQVSIVIAASHGSKGVPRRLFGSVCMGLVEQSAAPVLVVNTSETVE